MKYALLLIAGLIFVSCGDDASADAKPLKLETIEQKLSYCLGANQAKQILLNKQIHGSELNKKLLLQGFKANFSSAEPPNCEESFFGMCGPQGTGFNLEFVDEMSTCVGSYTAYMTFSELDQFDKVQKMDKEILFKGFEDGLNSADTLVVKMDEQRTILREYYSGLDALMQEELQKNFGVNKSEGETFLAENGKKPGVITTASGLQYKVIKKGRGEKPTLNSQVTVHYKGTLLDGREFDSSEGRDPITFQVTGVIPGWTEVLQLMAPGAKYEVYIPQEIAYADRPRPGGIIEPYMALIFEIELLKVQE